MFSTENWKLCSSFCMTPPSSWRGPSSANPCSSPELFALQGGGRRRAQKTTANSRITFQQHLPCFPGIYCNTTLVPFLTMSVHAGDPCREAGGIPAVGFFIFSLIFRACNKQHNTSYVCLISMEYFNLDFFLYELHKDTFCEIVTSLIKPLACSKLHSAQ